MGKYKERGSRQYDNRRKKRLSMKAYSRLSEAEKQELEGILDRARGPRVLPSRRGFSDSPTPEQEAKIQEALRKKGEVKYSKEYGAKIPSLTVKEAMQFMPPSKRSILESYESGKVAYLSKEKLQEAIKREVERIQRKIREEEEKIQRLERQLAENKSLEDLRKRGWIYRSYKEFVSLNKRLIEKSKKWIEQYKQVLEMYERDKSAVLDFLLSDDGLQIRNRYTTLEDALKEGYVVAGTFKQGESVWVQKPTLSGGVGVYVGPYHFRDSKTGEEVRLWEWGVDYDVG